MLRSIMTLGGLAIGLLWASAAAAGTKCSISAQENVFVTLDGKSVMIPIVLPNCEGVVVERGTINACVQDERGRLRCRTFSAQTILSAKALGPGFSDRGSLEVLIELLTGEAKQVGGVNRGEVVAGLPVGTIAFTAGDIVLDFTDKKMAGVERIDVVDSDSGANVLTLRTSGQASLRKKMFTPGGRYIWTIRSHLQMLDETTGRFNVARADEQREVEEEFRRVTLDEQAGPAGRALMLATWLQARGLRFDAMQILVGAGILNR